MRDFIYKKWKIIAPVCLILLFCVVWFFTKDSKTTSTILAGVGLFCICVFSVYALGFHRKPYKLLIRRFNEEHGMKEISPLFQNLKTVQKGNITLTYGTYEHHSDKDEWYHQIKSDFKPDTIKLNWVNKFFLKGEISEVEEGNTLSYLGYIDNFVFYAKCEDATEDELKIIKELIASFR